MMELGTRFVTRTDERLLAVRFGASHACSQCVLRIGKRVVGHAQVLARAAVPTFADYGQFGFGGRVHALNGRLKRDGVSQQLFQRGHIDDMGQAVERRGLKLHLPAGIAPDLHGLHRSDMGRLRPTTKLRQNFPGVRVEGKRAYIGGWCRMTHQGHTQALPRQQQGQCAADHATAAYANIKG